MFWFVFTIVFIPVALLYLVTALGGEMPTRRKRGGRVPDEES
jgi:hypothetical protein